MSYLVGWGEKKKRVSRISRHLTAWQEEQKLNW